ncbi:MAG: polysaccharide deacetylase family protein, partial [Gammaproteobacteria bacterium]|nr:polysaccharide deacetylase family protein [Gammaproteobacteria bacterium]
MTKNVFDMQINYISKHYSIISLDNLLDIINGKTFDKNKKYCVITFDDGWLDNYINAYPVLKKHNAPATI